MQIWGWETGNLVPIRKMGDQLGYEFSLPWASLEEDVYRQGTGCGLEGGLEVTVLKSGPLLGLRGETTLGLSLGS